MAKTLNGRWRIRHCWRRKGSRIFHAYVRDLRSGVVYQFSTEETKADPAEQAVINWCQEQEAREKAIVTTERDFPTAFNEYLSLKTCRPVTLDCYKLDLEGIYTPAFEGKLLGEITVGDIEKFISDLAKRKASARTRAKHLTAIRSFLGWCRRRGYIGTNPAEGIKAGRGDRRASRALTLEEAGRLLVAARTPIVVSVTAKRNVGGPAGGKTSKHAVEYSQGRKRPHLYIAVALAVYTGLRRRSIHELRWRDLDLGRGAIVVPPESMKAGRELQVPIHPALDRVLREALRSRKKRKVDPDAPVIGREVGKTVAALHGACRRAGLEPIGWHCLRHSYGAWMSERASFAVLRALLGHAPGNLVTAHYTHPRWEELVAAVGRLPDLIGEGAALPAAPASAQGTSA